eukprot:gnl/Trimastix_PCT/1065.p1 GENE.gnl/Trimastix_PCT/1065~~gnl/Trimastix_PCT/1065.p1  ORF type:complete len:218 (-),score=77.60 gnl/Trimastix_PCT/1065:373-1026(-)
MSGKPTYHFAMGVKDTVGVPSRQYSNRDLAAHTKLKTRQLGQHSREEVDSRDFRAELMAKERRLKEQGKSIDEIVDDTERPEEVPNKRARVAPERKFDDADDPAESSDSDSSDSDSESDEEDTAELLAELERIKRERAEQQKKQERQAKQEEDAMINDQVMRTNPLMNTQGFNVQGRWDDDVVFKNQTRGMALEVKRFINDTVRNDFHRKFMQRFVK